MPPLSRVRLTADELCAALLDAVPQEAGGERGEAARGSGLACRWTRLRSFSLIGEAPTEWKAGVCALRGGCRQGPGPGRDCIDLSLFLAYPARSGQVQRLVGRPRQKLTCEARKNMGLMLVFEAGKVMSKERESLSMRGDVCGRRPASGGRRKTVAATRKPDGKKDWKADAHERALTRHRSQC